MNRLAKASSPYLLQHKDNPVRLVGMGAGGASPRRRRRDRPVLLSVGYAACHWCHVMAHESFEDPGVAAVMNELFVNIKVDREERPDVDHIYMSALHAPGRAGRLAADHVPDPRAASRSGAAPISRRSRNSAGRASSTCCARCRASSAASRSGSRTTARVLIEPPRAQAGAGGRRPRPRPRRSRRRRRSASSAPSTRSHGGLRARRNSPTRRSSNSSGRYARRAGDAEARDRVLADASSGWRSAASTTISAAASRAIRSTSAGSCRISKRCSTTTPSCSSSMPSAPPETGSRCSASPPRASSPGSTARW